MPDAIVTALLWAGAVGCGLMAGVYFTFSAFAMRALGSLDPATGMAAMNAINAVILRSLFLPLFVGTIAVALALLVTGWLNWHATGSGAMLIGAIAYLAGMAGVTMAANVPMNDVLAAAGKTGAIEIWADYLRRWTVWNHVRTVASTAATIAFVHALAAR